MTRLKYQLRAQRRATFSGTLIVPDLPGEQVLSVYRTRQWSDEWETKIREGCSCLLFVRVDSKELKAPLDWLNCPEAISEGRLHLFFQLRKTSMARKSRPHR